MLSGRSTGSSILTSSCSWTTEKPERPRNEAGRQGELKLSTSSFDDLGRLISVHSLHSLDSSCSPSRLSPAWRTGHSGLCLPGDYAPGASESASPRSGKPPADACRYIQRCAYSCTTSNCTFSAQDGLPSPSARSYPLPSARAPAPDKVSRPSLGGSCRSLHGIS